VIDNKTILAVIPARGGSKGIKLKNLLQINNKSLIEYVSDVVKQCDFIDNAVVSTDHEHIRKDALRVGLDVPFFRPDSISGDCVSDVQVLQHAVPASEKYYKKTYDIILMLQPTSPLRKADHIRKCIDALLANGSDSCITVTQTDSKMHPLKQLCLDGSKLSYYDERGETIISRMMLDPVYHRNGVCYAFTRHCIMAKGKIVTEKSTAIVIDDFTVNIDTMNDVRCAELYLQGNS
jgi:CMP-N,N'-diacetyllegionaminic acid synthase